MACSAFVLKINTFDLKSIKFWFNPTVLWIQWNFHGIVYDRKLFGFSIWFESKWDSIRDSINMSIGPIKTHYICSYCTTVQMCVNKSTRNSWNCGRSHIFLKLEPLYVVWCVIRAFEFLSKFLWRNTFGK